MLCWLGVIAGGPVQAADLDDWIVAWTTSFDGDRGSDGRDEALDVAIDQTGHVVMAGFVDGAEGLGRTAIVATLENRDGGVLWFVRDDAGAVPETDDVYFAVDLAPGSNELAWCGQRAGLPATKPVDPVEAWFVDARVPAAYGIHYESVPGWSDVFEADPGSGGRQACRGLDRAGLTLFTTGDAATAQGGRQWVSRVYDAELGDLVDAVVFDQDDPADVATGNAIAGEPATGAFAVAGSVASQAVIRFVEPGGTVRWSDAVSSAGDGYAAFLDVAYDVGRGLVAAVGVTQRGTAQSPDIQGVVRVYGADGLDGLPDVRLDLELGTAAGDDHATSVAFDQEGRLLVGGSAADPKTGRERWRVVRLSEESGAELGSWDGPSTAGDSRVQSIAQRDEVLAAAGFVDRGNTVDVSVVVLGPDRDGDGTADLADQCPDDPDKILQGICDCGVPDVDTDGDDFEDCIDRCPDDPGKATRVGECGCGVPDDDTDSDGVVDCNDACPDDPAKVEVGTCGCGVLETDSDGDGVPNCLDDCESAPDDEVGPDGCEARSGCACGVNPDPSRALGWIVLIAIAARSSRSRSAVG